MTTVIHKFLALHAYICFALRSQHGERAHPIHVIFFLFCMLFFVDSYNLDFPFGALFAIVKRRERKMLANKNRIFRFAAGAHTTNTWKKQTMAKCIKEM